MYNIDVLEYKGDYIVIDPNGSGFHLKYNGLQVYYLDYTLKEALKLFKKHIKEVKKKGS